MDLRHRVLAIMEYGGGEGRIAIGLREDPVYVVHRAASAGCYDGDVGLVYDSLRQFYVVALPGSVGVDGGEQDLPGPSVLRLGHPFECVEARGLGASFDEDLVPALRGRRAFGVDGYDDALSSEPLGRLGYEVGVFDGGRVHGHLVRTGQEGGVDVLCRTDPSADGERDEDPLRGLPHQVEGGTPGFLGGCYV